jgi:hypothetical protein
MAQMPDRPDDRASVESLTRLQNQLVWSTLLLPILVVPAFGFAFVVGLRGRRELAFVMFLFSAVAFAVSVIVWAIAVY